MQRENKMVEKAYKCRKNNGNHYACLVTYEGLYCIEYLFSFIHIHVHFVKGI